MNKKDVEMSLAEIEEQIEIQILTLQVIRGHLTDLLANVARLKEDSV